MNNYLAEFIGTGLFVYVILATGNPLAIGAALALIVLLTANISGGHINPAAVSYTHLTLPTIYSV